VAAPATPGGCAAQQAAANAPGVLHIGIVDGVKE
jgi:hypothetical protein